MRIRSDGTVSRLLRDVALPGMFHASQRFPDRHIEREDIEKAIVTNQTVHIDADFPNAKDVHHIIEAIEGLANAAAQRANSKGY